MTDVTITIRRTTMPLPNGFDPDDLADACDEGVTDDDLEWLTERLGIADCPDQDDPEAPARSDLAREIRRAPHSALDVLLDGPRDVADAQFGGRRYWVTGGMSWGDSPTDSFDAVCVFDSLHLYAEPLPEAG